MRRAWARLRAHPWKWAGALVTVLVGGVFVLSAMFDGFRVELNVDRPIAVATEGSLQFEILGCSNSVFAVSVDERWATWRIVDVTTGTVVADTSHLVRTPVLRTTAFAPRQCRSALTAEWDGRFWNRDDPPDDFVYGNPVRGEAVPAGRYRLETFWGELEGPVVDFDIEEAS